MIYINGGRTIMIRTKNELEKRLVNIDGFMNYVGLGRNNAMKLGEEIGCLVKIGRKNLYDLRKADRYFDSLTDVN